MQPRGNNTLRPERQKEFESGVDIGLFNQMAGASVTYYRNNSVAVILQVPRAPETGFTSQLLNGASIRNHGDPLSLAPIAGPVTLADIMNEKYIVLF